MELITKFFQSLPHDNVHTLAISGTEGLLLAPFPDDSESESESEPDFSPSDTSRYTASLFAQLQHRLRESMGEILGGRNLHTVWIGGPQSVSILRLCNTLSVKHVFLTGRLSPLMLEETAEAEDPSKKLSLDSLTCVLHPGNGSRMTMRSEAEYVREHLPLVHPQSPFQRSALKKLVLEGGSVDKIGDILKETCNLEWFEFDWPSEFSRECLKKIVLVTAN
jgi:hypothetical protein